MLDTADHRILRARCLEQYELWRETLDLRREAQHDAAEPGVVTTT